METPILELEGTWEEIAARAAELRGHRLRVLVLPDEPAAPSTPGARRPNERALAALREIEARTRHMTPRPDTVDYLREGRAGDMYGYEPAE